MNKKSRPKRSQVQLPTLAIATSANQGVSALSSGKSSAYAKFKSFTMWMLIVLIPTIGAYFGLVEYFRSKLVLEIHTQDKDNAFDSYFKIQNQGSFTLSQLEYRCDILNTKLDVHDPKDPSCRNFTIHGIQAFWCIRHEEGARMQNRNLGFDEGYAARDLEPGEVDSDQMCKNPLIPVPAFLGSDGQAIELQLSYSVPWLALRSQKSFQFELNKGSEGTLAWFPVSKARR